MINQEWTIQSRAHTCANTGRVFTEGEYFYTLLFDETAGYRREDLCEEAYKNRPADGPQPFSLWRMKYAPPPPTPPEALGKATAEDLLRQYMAENTPNHTNARYLLAVMLERKRILKEIETKTAEDGTLLRIYEHAKTGEVFVIPDPQLQLDQLAAVQEQVADYLSPEPRPNAPAPEIPAPETAAPEASASGTPDLETSASD